MAETPEDLGAAEETVEETTEEVSVPENENNDNAQESNDQEPNQEPKKADNTKKGYWPEDWKEKYVEKQVDKDGKPLGDSEKDKLIKRLARYASPQAALDAMINAQNKISDSRMVKIPGKDSTPEEIAKYRESIGVPKEPKGYDLTLDDGMVIGDEDKDMIQSWLEIAHAGNSSQQQVTDNLNWLYKYQEDIKAKQYESDLAYKATVEDELRAEWGPEYRTNLNIMANYLGENISTLMTGATLADGTPLGNHPEILRWLVDKGREANPAAALVPGSGTKQHDQMILEIETLKSKMESDGALKGKDQDRYLKLVSLRDNIPEK